MAEWRESLGGGGGGGDASGGGDGGDAIDGFCYGVCDIRLSKKFGSGTDD